MFWSGDEGTTVDLQIIMNKASTIDLKGVVSDLVDVDNPQSDTWLPAGNTVCEIKFKPFESSLVGVDSLGNKLGRRNDCGVKIAGDDAAKRVAMRHCISRIQCGKSMEFQMSYRTTLAGWIGCCLLMSLGCGNKHGSGFDDSTLAAEHIRVKLSVVYTWLTAHEFKTDATFEMWLRMEHLPGLQDIRDRSDYFIVDPTCADTGVDHGTVCRGVYYVVRREAPSECGKLVLYSDIIVWHGKRCRIAATTSHGPDLYSSAEFEALLRIDADARLKKAAHASEHGTSEASPK